MGTTSCYKIAFGAKVLDVRGCFGVIRKNFISHEVEVSIKKEDTEKNSILTKFAKFPVQDGHWSVPLCFGSPVEDWHVGDASQRPNRWEKLVVTNLQLGSWDASDREKLAQ